MLVFKLAGYKRSLILFKSSFEAENSFFLTAQVILGIAVLAPVGIFQII